MGGDAGQENLAASEFHEKQDVQAMQALDVDAEEVTVQHTRSPGPQELDPGGSVPSGSRPEMAAAQDVAHRGHRHSHPDLGALPGDAHVAPAADTPTRPSCREARGAEVGEAGCSAGGPDPGASAAASPARRGTPPSVLGSAAGPAWRARPGPPASNVAVPLGGGAPPTGGGAQRSRRPFRQAWALAGAGRGGVGRSRR